MKTIHLRKRWGRWIATRSVVSEASSHTTRSLPRSLLHTLALSYTHSPSLSRTHTLTHTTAGGLQHAVRYRPHGGLRPFHQKSTHLTELTSGPYLVQIWSRYVQKQVDCNTQCGLGGIFEGTFAYGTSSLLLSSLELSDTKVYAP